MGYRAPGGQLSPASPGPRARGSNYFFGGPDANVSTGTQLVSLLAGAAGIQGTVYATLSGWLGGYATRLVVSFSGRGGRLLRMIWIGPVKAKSGAPVGGLRYRVLGATVPVGATEATIRLVMTRAAAGRGSEAADDLSLFLYQPGGGSG
jgi:hypothetical protein